MKKYIGIIKIYDESMSGVNIRLLSKTYDNVALINEWFKLYPKSEHIILQNTKEIDSMFKIFRDMTPITKEEKNSLEKAKVLRKRLMSDDD